MGRRRQSKRALGPWFTRAAAATTAATVTFAWLTPAAHAGEPTPVPPPTHPSSAPFGLPVPPSSSTLTFGAAAGIVPPVKAGVALGPAGGSEPVADGNLLMPAVSQPAAPAAPANPSLDPVALQIMTESSTTERLGEQLKQINTDLIAAASATLAARKPWDVATAQLSVQRARARDIAADAYKGALALGPLQDYANDLQDLGVVAPAFGQHVDAARRPPGRDSVQFDVSRAEALERTTRAAYTAALTTQQDLNTRRAVVKEQFDRHMKALKILRKRNADKLGAIDTARDTYETGLGTGRAVGATAHGWQVNQKALAAVQFALRQVGKPYVWAAEGPGSYDCSGLTYAAYGSVGVSIPRVAIAQYGALPRVDVSDLLPGDLLFFSNSNDWRGIHHVAMYIGNGQMVHAPTFGDHVRVAPIWWSEFYSAARVVPATRLPGAHPATTAPPTPTTAPPVPTTARPTTAAPTTAPRPTTGPPRVTRPPATLPPVTKAPPKTNPPVTTAPPPTTGAATTAPATTAEKTAAAPVETTKAAAGTTGSSTTAAGS